MEEKERYLKNRDYIIKRQAEYVERNRAEIKRKGREKYANGDADFRDRLRQYQIEYRKNNREKKREYAKQYLEKNREIVNLRIANYRKTDIGKHKFKLRDYKRRFLSKDSNGIGELTYSEWEEILRLHKYQCARCGANDDITIDHIIPLSKGGTHTKDNVQPLCRRCNSSKRAVSIRYLTETLPLPLLEASAF